MPRLWLLGVGRWEKGEGMSENSKKQKVREKEGEVDSPAQAL